MTENKIVYPLFTNKKTGKTLVFYPVKKNANSSAKLFFAKQLGIEDKFFFIEDEIPRVEQTAALHSKFKNQINLISWFQSNKFQKINADFRSCIIRDPIKRFTSAYKNRILFHKDPDFFDHSVDLIIDKLENKIFENMHFLPQNYWLGDNLNFFNIVGNVSNINKFVSEINKFFGNKINFPKIQTGGKEFNVSLSQEQEKKIKKIYEKDYDIFYEFIF